MAELQEPGSTVAMVGDGVNDTPALIQADVGIAIGAGTDVAIGGGGVVRASDDPRPVVAIRRLSQASYRRMLQNPWWAAATTSLRYHWRWCSRLGRDRPRTHHGGLLMSVSTVIVAIARFPGSHTRPETGGMTARVRRVFILMVVLSIILSACSNQSGNGETDMEPQDPEVLEAGAELYAVNCAECHGDDLRGTDRGPSHLSEVYEPSHHGDGAFQVAVLAGSPQHHWDFGPMPPVQGLTETDVEAIIAFVRERQRIEGFESYPP